MERTGERDGVVTRVAVQLGLGSETLWLLPDASPAGRGGPAGVS